MPVAHETNVGLRAELIISGEDVEVQGVLGRNFFFELSQEARLGTPISFAYWLKEVYAVDSDGIRMLTLTEHYATLKEFQAAYKAHKAHPTADLEQKIIANLKQHNVPEQVHRLMVTALLAELSITDLVIDIKKDATANEDRKKLKFGLAISFPSPLQLLPNIDVKRVSILILHTPVGDTSFPTAEIDLGKPAPVKIKASGFISFSANPVAGGTITLGGAKWTFVSGEPKASETKIVDSDLDKTLVALARDLNRLDSPEAIRKCTYRADLQNGRLLIEYNEPGPEGNAFTLAADLNSKGTSSPTLQGGEDPEAPLPRLTAPAASAKASGTIKIKKAPKDLDTITLNGTVFTFKTAAADATDVTVDPDIGKVLGELIEKIDKVAALKNYEFTREGNDTLKITAKVVGSAGESFTLAVDSKTTGTFDKSGDNLKVSTT